MANCRLKSVPLCKGRPGAARGCVCVSVCECMCVCDTQWEHSCLHVCLCVCVCRGQLPGSLFPAALCPGAVTHCDHIINASSLSSNLDALFSCEPHNGGTHILSKSKSYCFLKVHYRSKLLFSKHTLN